MSGDDEITMSSGNVFADLGLPNPEERLLKAQLATQIQDIIECKGWTQVRAPEVIGMDQPRLSQILRGRLSGISVERLLTILTRLGHDVEVRISAKEREPEEAQVSVRVVESVLDASVVG